MKVKYLVIHHSASSSDTTVKQIDSWHKARGFRFAKPKPDYPYGHIGYHKIILSNGTIVNGRPEKIQGAHCVGRNRDSIGICCIGNFTNSSPSSLQIEGLTHCCVVLCKRYGLDPEVAITAHKDWNSTACPAALYSYKDEIISRVKKEIENV